MIILPSLEIVPAKYDGSTLLSQIPIDGTGDFTVSRALNTATRVNSLGNIEVVNADTPRIDYFTSGGTVGCPALLVEPSGTNGIRNNSMIGASAPNTLPNNWSSAGSNLTRQSVVTGSLSGIPYVDVRVSGTANSTFYDIFWETSNAIAASVGQDWVASCYLQIVAQPNPPVNFTFAMREFNLVGGFLGIFQSTALSISTTSLNRFSFTRALNQATVAFVNLSLLATLVSGQTYDFTIRIGYPQMERGTVATSVIPTTTGSVTRNADVITDTTASGVIGQTEGTIYAEFINTFSSSYNDGMLIRVFADANNEVFGRKEAASNRYTFRWRANSQNTTFTNVNVPDGVNKVALAYKSGDTALFLNGVQIGSTSTDVRAFSVNPTTVALGSNGGAGQFFNDRIRAVALYNTRLIDAELATLTTP